MDLLGKVTLSTPCQKSRAASINSAQLGFRSLHLGASLPAFLVDGLHSHSKGMLFINLWGLGLEIMAEDAFTSTGKSAFY